MRLLVTGACGYKGTVLVPKLLGAGHEVIAFDSMWFGNYLDPRPGLQVVKGDVRDTDSIDLAGIEAIIHLASVANDPCGDLDPKLTWEVSALATMQLADRAARHGIPPLHLRLVGQRLRREGRAAGYRGARAQADLRIQQDQDGGRARAAQLRRRHGGADRASGHGVRIFAAHAPRRVGQHARPCRRSPADASRCSAAIRCAPTFTSTTSPISTCSCSIIPSTGASTTRGSRTSRSGTSPSGSSRSSRPRSWCRAPTIRDPTGSTPTSFWRPDSGRRRPSTMPSVRSSSNISAES